MSQPGSENEGGVPVTGVSELVLEVLDLDRSLRFYSEVLGLPVVARWEDSERAWLMAGERTRIGLWRPQVGLADGRGGGEHETSTHPSRVAAGPSGGPPRRR